MSRTLKIILLVIILSFVLGFIIKDNAKQDGSDEILNKSLKQFKSLRSEQLLYYKENVVPNYDGENTYYYASLDKKNANKVASFEILVNNNKDLLLKKFTISYVDSLYFHFTRKDNDIDTLYYFKVNRTHGIKKFVLGKYNYYFEKGKLKPEHFKYYLEHRDSLRKIRGDIPIFGDKN